MAGVPAANPRVFGKYEVIRRLAVGGMGEIFLARQMGMAGFDRLVTLKSLLPQLASDADMLTQFLDEARIVGSINHPNVVACYEVGEWEGVYFIAMEYINGVDIAALQKAADDVHVRFPVHVAMAITREAALGLDSAHHAHDSMGRALKIVHRDISPHNIMVRQDGLAKVVDFGVAVAANRQKRTEGGLLKGKLGYMAPEQIKGMPLDGRSDQFSLGVMLWELLTGRRLFTAEDPHAVFMKIVREVVPAPSTIAPDVPKELDAVVLKMTSQEPGDRYPRLGETAAALRKLLELMGARDNEPADAVRDLVGAQLAERVRDLTPLPVKILGIVPGEAPPSSSVVCKACGEKTVQGDRFCRACGTPLSALRLTPPPTQGPMSMPPVPHPVDDEFAEVADDMIDVTFDDGSGPAETAAVVGTMELVDFAGVHHAPDAMLRAVFAHVEELASRFGGAVVTNGARITATFSGNGRGARSAIAFARRATGLAMRANRDLRLRAGVGAAAGTASGPEAAARDEAERAVARAKPGAILVSESAKRLASVAHWYGPAQVVASSSLPGGSAREAFTAYELPLAPRYAGRASERIILEQAIAAADVGRAQQHLFLGDAGLGKSALLQIVDAEARDRGFIVAHARCQRARAMRYDVVRQAVRSACVELLAVAGDSTGTSTLSVGTAWRKALEPLALSEGDKRRLCALVDDEPYEDADVPLARRRVLLRASILGFFAAVAERRGVCVCIDDVHRGDASSLEVFAEVGARLHASRFAIFAAGRPMQGERVLPLAKRSVLEPLDAKDIGLVATYTAGGALPDAVTEKIAQRAKGNPLYASLLTRHLVALHLLQPNNGVVVASVDIDRYPLPPNADVLAFASHALLPAETRAALAAAAHADGAFDAADVAAMLGGTGAAVFGEGATLDVAGALAAAAKAGVVVDDAGRFTFSTSTERDVLAARADPVSARAWHSRLAAGLEARARQQGRRSVGVEERLVHHKNAADDKDGAAEAAEHAAEAWARLGAPEATTDYYKRALHALWRAASVTGVVVDEAHAGHALDLAARATRVVGEVDPASAVDLAMPLVRALPPGAATSQRIDALSARASLLLKLRRPEEAENVLDEALDAFASQAGPSLRASLLIDVAAALEQSGNHDAARTQIVEALRVLGEAPADGRRRAVDALLALGRLHLRGRDMAKAREHIQAALAEANKSGGSAQRIDVLTALAALEQTEQKPAAALAAFEQALAIAGKAGDAVAEARLRQQIARLHQQTGRFPEALAAARLSLSTAQRLAWDEGMAVAGQLVATLEQRA